jgi:hypothetical protein
MRVSFFAVCFYGRGGAVNISAAAHSAHIHTLRKDTRAIIPQIKGNGLRQRPQCRTCLTSGGIFG